MNSQGLGIGGAASLLIHRVLGLGVGGGSQNPYEFIWFGDWVWGASAGIGVAESC